MVNWHDCSVYLRAGVGKMIRLPPFHTVEGNSGVFITPTAYLTNPPKEGQTWGLPSISVSAAIMEHVDFQSFGITENVLGRFELGYAMEPGLNDWPGDVRVRKEDRQRVYLHNFNPSACC